LLSALTTSIPHQPVHIWNW